MERTIPSAIFICLPDFVGCQLCWKDHLVFICNAVCMYKWMNGCQVSSTSKGKPSLFNENAMTDFRQT